MAGFPKLGGGIPLALIDAAGDLIVGSANDAAARLALGGALTLLQVNSAGTALEYGGQVTSGIWTDYTPVLTQSGAVTKTITYARFARVGRLIVVEGALTATGAGTAANIITVSLPVTAASSAAGNLVAGSFYLADVSVAAGAGNFIGATFLNTTTTLAGFVTAAANFLGAGGSVTALAAGDIVAYSAIYEAAT